MQRKIVHIYFSKPVSQENLNSFKENLFDFDLEFLGEISPSDISGEVRSTGMFRLIKAPLLKVLEYSGLSDKIKDFTITNI